MTTTPPNTSPSKTGTDDAAAKVTAKAALEAKAKKNEKRKKNKKNKPNNNNNNNQVKCDGLITDGILKDVTITPGSNARMAADYRKYKKSAGAYAAWKGYEYWPGVIDNLEAIPDTKWETARPDKSLYATKCITKIEQDGTLPDIMK